MWRRTVLFLQDFFSVSPKEARGVFVLILLSALALIFPVFLKGYLRHRPQSEIAEERRVIDSLLRALIKDRQAGWKGGPPVTSNDTITVRREEFNPNTVSEQQLIGFGLPASLARRVINYRSKGGVFRKKEDLRKIYGFPGEMYLTLAPYIRIENAVGGQPVSLIPESGQVTGPSGDRWSGRLNENGREVRFKPASVIVPFDINRADTSQLKQLRGIGSSRARTIINYRNALGGFHSEKQYPEIFGLDSLSLSQLSRYARVMSPPAKLPINVISADQLMRHPYAGRNRRLSEAVIRYRDQHGTFAGREDLDKIVNVTPRYIEALLPYLEF